MIPDGLQYFLDDFWNDQNVTKYGPHTYHISKTYKKHTEPILKLINFRNLKILDIEGFEHVGKIARR